MFRRKRGRNVVYYRLKRQKAALKRPQGQVKPSVRKAGYRKKFDLNEKFLHHIADFY